MVNKTVMLIGLRYKDNIIYIQRRWRRHISENVEHICLHPTGQNNSKAPTVRYKMKAEKDGEGDGEAGTRELRKQHMQFPFCL